MVSYPGSRLRIGTRARAGSGGNFFAGASADGNFTTGSFSGFSLGDITTSRASSGYAETTGGTLTSFGSNVPRITNKGLLVEESRQNLLLQSQDLGTTWATSGGSVTLSLDATAAPDGTTTADQISCTTGNVTHVIQQTINYVSGTTYACSVYAKAGTDTRVQICPGLTGFSTGPFANFDLSGGTVTQTGGTLITATIQAMANGWYRCTLVATADASAAGVWNIVMINSPTAARALAFAGTATNNIYAWGAQCEATAGAFYASSYITTTTVAVTRAADAISWSGTNFNTAWNNATGSAYVEGITAFSNSGGAATRRLMEIGDGTSANRHVVGASASTTPRYLATSSSATQADVNPTENITIVGSTQKLMISWNTNDFQACANSVLGTQDVSGTVPAGVTKMYFGADLVPTTNTFWNGYIQRVALWKTRQTDAQMQAFTLPQTFMQTGATFDQIYNQSLYYGKVISDYTVSRASTAYEDTTSGTLTSFGSNVIRITNKGELGEESRQNICLQSQTLDNASWTKTNTTVTANTTAAPDATTTADTVTCAAASSTFFNALQTFTVTASTTYTLSVYAKAGTSSYIQLVYDDTAGNGTFANYDLSTGTVAKAAANSGTGTAAAATITAMTNGWYRLTLSGQHGAVTGRAIIEPLTAATVATAGLVPTLSFAGTETLIYWGAQVEAGTFATSYIPTTTVAVTRAADVVSLTGTAFSDWYTNAAAGTLYWEGLYPPDNGASHFMACISDGTTGNEIQIYQDTGAGKIAGQIRQAAADQALIISGAILTPGQRFKAAIAWASNDCAFYVNGTQIGTDASVTVPTVSQFNLGCRGASIQFANTYAVRTTFFPSRIANSTLVTMTT